MAEKKKWKLEVYPGWNFWCKTKRKNMYILVLRKLCILYTKYMYKIHKLWKICNLVYYKHILRLGRVGPWKSYQGVDDQVLIKK